MKFTTTWLDRLKPQTERQDFSEDGHPGFMLRLWPTGAKSFVYRYQMDGKRQIMTLGPYPALTLAVAHERCDAARKLAKAGIDPMAAAEADTAQGLTLGELADTFYTKYLLVERKRPLEAKKMLDFNLTPELRAKQAQIVTKKEITKLLDSIVARGSKKTANRMGALLRQMYGWGIDEDLVTGSPMVRIKPRGGREPPRTRWLNDAEIVTVWHTLDRCGMTNGMRWALRLLLTTATRRIEVASLRWSHIDMTTKTWVIPKEIAKNKVETMVPLSPLALTILGHLKDLSGDSAFVCPGARRHADGDQHITEDSLTRTIAGYQSKFGIPHFTPHDFRRTARTNFSRFKVPREVSELILNHKKKDLDEVYNLWEFIDEKREALDKWAAHLESLTQPKTGTNVLPFPAKATG